MPPSRRAQPGARLVAQSARRLIVRCEAQSRLGIGKRLRCAAALQKPLRDIQAQAVRRVPILHDARGPSKGIGGGCQVVALQVKRRQPLVQTMQRFPARLIARGVPANPLAIRRLSLGQAAEAMVQQSHFELGIGGRAGRARCREAPISGDGGLQPTLLRVDIADKLEGRGIAGTGPRQPIRSRLRLRERRAPIGHARPQQVQARQVVGYKAPRLAALRPRGLLERVHQPVIGGVVADNPRQKIGQVRRCIRFDGKVDIRARLAQIAGSQDVARGGADFGGDSGRHAGLSAQPCPCGGREKRGGKKSESGATTRPNI